MATAFVNIAGIQSAAKNISAADATRLQNAIKARFFRPADTPTNQQLVDAWANWLWVQSIDLVVGVERQSTVITPPIIS